MMLQYIIPLISAFLPLWDYCLVYVFALAFLTFALNFISSFWRS